MAYFPNGTSWEIWHEENCLDGCVHYDPDRACPIEILHFEYSYASAGSTPKAKRTRQVLNMFIPEEGIQAKPCAMLYRKPDHDQLDMFDDGGSGD